MTRPLKFKDRTGDVEGLLTYVRYHSTLKVESESRGYKYFAQWVCRCECGEEVIRIAKSTNTKTCGASACRTKMILRGRK